MKKFMDLVKQGYKPKQAIAKSIAMDRKAKKMSFGGMVDDDLDAEHERSLTELMIQGDQTPVANPEVLEAQQMLASNLHKESEDEEYYAMGGLVQGDTSDDEPVGNKPSEDMSSTTEEPMDKKHLSPMLVGPEAMAVLMEKKKNRKFKK